MPVCPPRRPADGLTAPLSVLVGPIVRRLSAVSGPVVGMIGGGQLARMTAQAAITLGVELRVLASSPDDAAARVSPTVIGDYRSLPDVVAFADRCDVLTFDHEHVPLELLRTLAQMGHRLHPAPEALRFAQDKWAMRERLQHAGIPVPAWRVVTSAVSVSDFAAEHGWPVVAKRILGGYDGRGVWVLPDAAGVTGLLAGSPEEALLVEEFVPLRRELAALLARSPNGEVRAWPLVETVQRNGICVETLAPADDPPASAVPIAVQIAALLEVTGVLAVELFERADGTVAVNELAMRPHNSGHWTIEGARTSQFEQHLRAVLDWPLGDTTATAPVVATANVLGSGDGPLGGRLPGVLAVDPALKVHLYGKEPRVGRKLGHVSALGAGAAAARRRARAGAVALSGASV